MGITQSNTPAEGESPRAGDTGTYPGGFEWFQREALGHSGSPFHCSATLTVRKAPPGPAEAAQAAFQTVPGPVPLRAGPGSAPC